MYIAYILVYCTEHFETMLNRSAEAVFRQSFWTKIEKAKYDTIINSQSSKQ